MEFGDLNDPVYNEMYKEESKLYLLEELKENLCDTNYEYVEMMFRSLIYGIEKDVKEYACNYLIVEEIDKEIKKLNVDNTILENKDFLLFKLNKNLMNKLYKNTQNKKYLLFVKNEKEDYKEIIVSFNIDKENTIFYLKVEDKEYTYKIDYNNPVYGLCYYCDTEKIVIMENKIGSLILKINGSKENSCVYTLYDAVFRCGNEN